MIKNTLIAISILLVGCTPADTPPPGPPEPLTLAYTLQPESALIHIALDRDYFKQEGLEIKPQQHSFGKAALQAVIEGKADLATAAETPIMLSILNGKPLAIISTIVTTGENNAVIGRRDSGINSAKDLKGKRIGYTAGTTGDFFLHALLNANGLAREQVTLINLKPDDMLAALQNGQISATSTWNYPLQHIKQTLGNNAIAFVDREVYTQTFNVVASPSYTKANPEAIKRFLRALLKAEKFLTENQAEAQAIKARVTQTELATVRALWSGFQHRVQLQPTLLFTLEDQARWAIKSQLTRQTEVPNYLDHIRADYLLALKPDVVRISQFAP
ncbi:MAG: NrtA/SsuA/CpmA family ABC transporter substrate-binding protein [Betaproteobacteria bacterium]|nr:NrtA/SsuA/CpmA family ABC transporter substrate-binding protein [Betaproteobacteria bacterium]